MPQGFSAVIIHVGRSLCTSIQDVADAGIVLCAQGALVGTGVACLCSQAHH